MRSVPSAVADGLVIAYQSWMRYDPSATADGTDPNQVRRRDSGSAGGVAALRSAGGVAALRTRRRREFGDKGVALCGGKAVSNCDEMKCFATNLSRIWRHLPMGIRGAGLNLGDQLAEFMSRHTDARARWLELRNKIIAYRLFESGEDVDSISRLDPYSRLFAAEGYGYRNVRAALLPEMPARLSPIAIHAGVGLRLAEQTLERLDAGEDLLAEFFLTCRQYAWNGYAGIMEESLGLIALTLYPQSISQIDERLRVMSVLSWKRFWHGVGRGIYFVAPRNGIDRCMSEPPDDTAKRNALSGFCFALTLVNLRHPEVLAEFLRRNETDAVGYSDGINAALVVWKLSCNETAETRGFAPVYSREPERLFAAQEEKIDEQYANQNLCRAS